MHDEFGIWPDIGPIAAVGAAIGKGGNDDAFHAARVAAGDASPRPSSAGRSPDWP